MASFEIQPRGPYSLAASIRFLEGFTPAAYERREDGGLRLAFVVDGEEDVAGVYAREEGGVVSVEVYGDAETEAVREQVRRILSLDVDGGEFPRVGERDAVVGGLQRRYPGLRPVGFNSPYEAAAWAIIGNRVRITQAAKVKAALAKERGVPIEVRGEVEHAFPAPSVLARLDEFPGLSQTKVERLRSLGEAAAAGKLDARKLRSLPAEEALARLKELPGIGDFSAELVLLRGAGAPDLPARSEPRLRRAVALAYGLEEPPEDQGLREISEGWRPYRTWVGLLLRTMLEDETREIRGS